MRTRISPPIFLLLILAVFKPVFGATFTVTNTNDSGVNSLRAAIASGANTINFNLMYPATITLTSGSLTINSTGVTGITITGPGSSSLKIDATNNGGQERVFTIAVGRTVSISGLTVTGGRGGGTSGGSTAGNGGGIFNSATLSLSDVIVSGNRVGGSANGGGGIFNAGGATLTLTDCTVSGNTAGGGSIPPSGNPITGGGIRNSSSGSLTLTNTTVSNNTAHVGGGIFNTGTLTVTGSTFSGNSAGVGVSTTLPLEGGGIYVNGPSTGNTIINSTFSGNQAKDDGGGIANAGALSVSNSTFFGNIAQGGGALGGAVSALNHTLTLKSSILANSTGGNCVVSGGTLTSDGYNLSTDASCPLGAGDKPASTPAGLDSAGLQNNGGPTQTIALLSGSAAKDAIPIASCTAIGGSAVSTDQRGVARPQPLGGACDIGAFELQQSSGTTVTNTNDTGIGSLRGVIAAESWRHH